MGKYLEVKAGKTTICKLRISERPFRNLHEYRVSCCHYVESLIKDPNAWPCLFCGAAGWIYHPDEKPCPVEGMKMARRIKCPVCSGTRLGTKAQIEEAYKKRIDSWRKESEAERERNNLLACALSKLSQKEVDVLLSVMGEHETSMYDKNPKIVTLGVKCGDSCKTE